MTKYLVVYIFLISGLQAANYIPEPPRIYEQIALENQIPAKIFYAIILNESRSLVNLEAQKTQLPWPWTINYKGKGYYFKTRIEAYEFIKPLIDDGQTMGIGLGQLEWRWHKDKFANPWEALDPYINLTAAAKYIRKQYERKECSTWFRAIGCYHRSAQGRKDKAIALAYTERVLRIWEQII